MQEATFPRVTVGELTLKLIADRSINGTIPHIDRDHDESIDLFQVVPHTLAVPMTSKSQIRCLGNATSA